MNAKFLCIGLTAKRPYIKQANLGSLTISEYIFILSYVLFTPYLYIYIYVQANEDNQLQQQPLRYNSDCDDVCRPRAGNR